MNKELTKRIKDINSIFIDTAPIIYYIEAHPQFGPITKNLFDALQTGKHIGYSSFVALE